MWKIILDSARGTAHEKGDSPCQDACAATELEHGGSHILALVCADGAGSASRSNEGSQFVCNELLRCVTEHFALGRTIGEMDYEAVLRWFRSIRAKLSLLAQQESMEVGAYACTALLAVADDTCAVFAQIGDGAIVIGDTQQFGVVFWPEHTEYLNITTFVTSDGFESALNYAFCPTVPSQIGLLTDGLQMIALDFANQSAHSPFFSSLFKRLDSDEEPEELSRLLTQFLNSKEVNQRTDDDKTLLLACRTVCSQSQSTAPYKEKLLT